MSKEAPKKLTEMQESFLSFLFGEAEGNVRQAMELAGYSRTTKPSDVLPSLSDEISSRAAKHLSAASARAVFSLISVLDSPHQNGAGNRIKAASQILDRAGIVKKAEEINLKIPEQGIVILPAKSGQTAAQVADQVADQDESEEDEVEEG